MKKSVLRILLLTLLVAPILGTWAQAQDAGSADRSVIRIALGPFGGYDYVAEAPGPHYNHFFGGYNELSLSYEFRAFDAIGLEGFLDFKGHRYQSYQDSSNAIVRAWGLPGLRIGAGAVYRFLEAPSWELSGALGVSYVIYLASLDELYPGVGASGRLEAIWHPMPHLGIGAQIRGHLSSQSSIDISGMNSRYPFYLCEFCVGLMASVSF
jgi:hypothetical protein